MLVGSSAAVMQAEGLTSWRLSGLPLIVSRVNLDVTGLTTLITPLLLLVGLGVAGFAAKLAGWGVDIVEDRLPRPTTFVLLVLAVAWQLWQVVPPSISRFQDAPKTESLSMLSALGVPRDRRTVLAGRDTPGRRVRPATDALSAEEVSGSVDRWSAPLVVAYSFPVLCIYAVSVSALMLTIVTILLGYSNLGQMILLGGINLLGSSPFLFGWHLAVDALAVLVGLRLAWLGYPAAMLFLGTYG
jgi:hypothetical protein